MCDIALRVSTLESMYDIALRVSAYCCAHSWDTSNSTSPMIVANLTKGSFMALAWKLSLESKLSLQSLGMGSLLLDGFSWKTMRGLGVGESWFLMWRSMIRSKINSLLTYTCAPLIWSKHSLLKNPISLSIRREAPKQCIGDLSQTLDTFYGFRIYFDWWTTRG